MIYGGYFEVDSKLDEIKSLEKLVNSPSFWDNTDEANKIIEKLNNLKNSTSSVVSLSDEIKDCIDLIGLLEEEIDEDILSYVEDCYSTLEARVSRLELELLLSGEYDANNAIVEIHSGAGGTEACDWASMLYRMYIRWCEDKDYKVEVLDLLEGEEAGIKRVSFLVKGLNAYGYLKCEKGIHRLVRLSPFDSNNKRHTSFASVEVTPEIDNTVSVQINDEDLKIDVYRSSGAGGQGVNTTDSAVRVTHLPTKIVVTCQNERSQLKNKETALKILMNKLYELELKKNEEKINSLKNNDININFGSQIRSYVLEPYKLVKDNRSNYENNDPDKILNGDILEMLEYNLKKI